MLKNVYKVPRLSYVLPLNLESSCILKNQDGRYVPATMMKFAVCLMKQPIGEDFII